MNNENRQIMAGETMFEFLKRKKKFMLEKTLQKTGKSPAGGKTRSNDENYDANGRSSKSHIKDGNSKQVKKGLNANNDSTTPRRAQLVEDQRRPARSFLQMISPIRSKSPSISQTNRSINHQSDNQLRKVGQRKKQDKQNFTKKMVWQKIGMMRDIIQTFIRAGKGLKQKANLLFVVLKPFLRQVQNGQHQGLLKKTQEIKAKVLTLQNIFKEFDSERSQQSIKQFYSYFSQYINELEGHARAKVQVTRQNTANQILSAKGQQIKELEEENKRLIVQLNYLSKQYDKQSDQLERNHKNNHAESQSLKNNSNTQIRKLQQSLLEIEKINISLKNENIALNHQINQLEAEVKQANFLRKKFQEDCLSTMSKVKSQQQQFLLNQIVVLKNEFNVDINKMAELHKIKQDEFIANIHSLQNNLISTQQKYDHIASANLQIEESMTALKAQNSRLKKQAQCMGIDLHRINQELYQHWLALSDIKTLTQRLDIYTKFRNIFEDLKFNQQLFL